MLHIVTLNATDSSLFVFQYGVSSANIDLDTGLDISLQEVKDAIVGLKKGKAVGFDGILAEVLSVPAIVKFVYVMFGM
jgi:hypothetical protein